MPVLQDRYAPPVNDHDTGDHALQVGPSGRGKIEARNRTVRRGVLHLTRQESVMGLAEYMIVAQGDEWGVLHDGSIKNRYATKEAAFEAAVAAASLAIREGHEVHLSVPDRSAGNQTTLGAKE
jgi:hypothetical protein